MAIIDNENYIKNIQNFVCETCDFKCCKKGDWTRHLMTRKHKNGNIFDVKDNNLHHKNICACGKKYNYSSGLSRHKQSCSLILNKLSELEEEQDKDSILEEKIKEMVKNALPTNLLENALTPINNEFTITQDFIKEIFKQNQEFQSNICNQITELFKNSNTTNNIVNGNINNTQNNQFNLQVYLNETCKNAMTIDQFLDYLQPTIEELEDTARLGYVEGITRIIMRGLKDLEEELRPFHCSDLKRETLFVKNPDGEWEKDTEEKKLMLNFVKAVARKNFNNVNEWRKLHPNCRYHDSKSNDMFNQIMLNSTSGRTEEEQKASYEKIIKNITKEIVIDKSKKNKVK